METIMENSVLLNPQVPAPTVSVKSSYSEPEPPEVTEDFDEIPEPPRAVRRVYRRRCRIPLLYSFTAVAGTAAGVFLAAYAPAGTDFSDSLMCASGDFLWLLLVRLLWGCAFLLAEYIIGYFALGGLLIWAVPLIGGLGTGAALSGAFSLSGIDALKLIPTSAVIVIALIMGVKTSCEMSDQLLRLVSTNKNSIVATSPAAGEYTLRFLVYLAILSGSAIVEAAVRSFT